MNKSKAKGTAAESALTRWLRANGYPWAERLALSGAADCGDISLLPGHAVIVEVKSHASAATGQPKPSLLATWMGQTEAERVNAGADVALLVVKRAATTDPARWWCYLPLGTLLELTGATLRAPVPSGVPEVACMSVSAAPWLLPSGVPEEVACMSVSAAAWLLRAAGYGSVLEEASYVG